MKKKRVKHGKSKDPIYWSWSSMMNRCYNPKRDSYKNYGGRGIRVCKRWHLFANFYADMSPRPNGLSLDRINNDGNYEPSNCRWATNLTQQNNSRINRILCVDGEEFTLSEASRKWGNSIQTIFCRLQLGWNESDAAKMLPKKQMPYKLRKLNGEGVICDAP